jgi:hypothetical protein
MPVDVLLIDGVQDRIWDEPGVGGGESKGVGAIPDSEPEEATVAKLTTKKRKKLAAKSFVFPKTRKFPIEDKAHARDALSRAAAKGGSVEAKVRAAVKKKYPSIGKKKTAGAARKKKKR